MFKSIQSKILALLLLGFFLACLLSGIGVAVDRFKTRTMANSNRTQQLALQLAEQMLLEEQFISSHDDALLSRIRTSEKQLTQTLSNLQHAIRIRDMSPIVATIVKINAARQRVFVAITDNLETIAAAMAEHHDVTNQMMIEILSLIGLIDQAESQALEQGQALAPNETILRNKLKSLTDVVKQRVLAVQSFYIRLDFAAFQEARASLRDLSSIENMLKFLDHPQYLTHWNQFTPLWEHCAQVETTLEQELTANVALKNRLQQRGRQMQAMLHQMVAVSDESIKQATMISQSTILLGFMVGTLMIGVVGGAIIRATRKSLLSVIAGFNALVSGKGDLTYRLPIISQDELGQLCQLFNQFMEQLHTLVQVIQTSGLKIMTSSTELSAMARQQEVTLEHQVQATEHVAADIQRIAQAAMNLADEMSVVAAMTHTSAEAANSSQMNLERLDETFQRLEHAAGAISQKLETINQKAENITSIVTTINKVADQTNLLSLNAAIEAEKAGEFGRGFTVVAREIRRLADQTAAATLDIGQMVHEMQQAVTVGVMEMDKFLSVVRSGAEDVGKVSDELFAFIEHVQSLSPKFAAMNTAMLDQSSRAQVSQTEIHHLRDSMAEIKATLHETYIAIEQLNETARALQGQVERFKLI